MTHSHIVAFPSFLQTHYIRNIAVVKKFYVLDMFLFHRESSTLFGPVFRMIHIYKTSRDTHEVAKAVQQQPAYTFQCAKTVDLSSVQTDTSTVVQSWQETNRHCSFCYTQLNKSSLIPSDTQQQNTDLQTTYGNNSTEVQEMLWLISPYCTRKWCSVSLSIG